MFHTCKKNSDYSAEAWAKIFSQGTVIRDRFPDHNCLRTLYYSSRDDWETGEGKKVLDVGFGSGELLAYFGKIDYELFGTEISMETINETQAFLKGMNLSAELKMMDEKLDFPDDSFDLVVCWGTLHFLGSEEGANNVLSEIKRVLKPGGTFIGSNIRPDNSQIIFSKKIENNVYEIREDWPWDDRKGSRLFCISEADDLKNYVGQLFEGVKVGSFGSDIPNGWANWHYCFSGTKPTA